jgi:hypothetical protein
MKSVEAPSDRDPFMILVSGRIRCRRCQALSKRTKQQCKAPAVRDKSCCVFHGGKSTGPLTEGGRKRCAVAKMIHGKETRSIRAARSATMAELAKIIEGW